MPRLENYVVIFDLDDTLYKEHDYVESGKQAILDKLLELGIVNQAQVTRINNLELGHEDLVDTISSNLSLPSQISESLLWVYRLHTPRISLDQKTLQVLSAINSASATIGIITDGRSLTQKLKLKSLGLSHLRAFVSSDYENGKPHPAMFLAAQETWPNRRYVYVADNIVKDFIAPNKLGWLTVGLEDDGRNIRKQNIEIVSKDARPRYWIKSLGDLLQLLNL